MAVDMSRFQRTVLDDAIRKATALQSQGRRLDAAAAWDQAATHADFFAQSASSATERTRRCEMAADFRRLSIKLRKVQESNEGKNAVPVLETTENEFRDAARRLIHRSSIGFQDIAGLDETRREIQSAFARALAIQPDGIAIPQMKNMLFYGPPGCGKTLLAAAVSNVTDATFFSVKVSDLLSRYYGDSPRLVQALYDEARSHGSSIVFLDEIDALAGSRTGSDSSADRHLKNSLLNELDGLNEKGSERQVQTIAATNRPWELDEAILSRFEKSVYIPLPDRDSRRELLRLQLQAKGHRLNIAEEILLSRTEGLSGREIAHLSKMLIEDMIAESNPDIVNVAMQGRDAIQHYQIKVSPIELKHLDRVRDRVQARTSPEAIELFRRWASAE